LLGTLRWDVSNSAHILNNAAMSIQVGVEDLVVGTPARTLSSVRSLHAGVLLLLKARLLDLSPEGSDEVLLKQKIKPTLAESGELQFVGSGHKTVDVEEIKQRLKSFGVTVEWKRLDKLTAERNSIEHYYPQVSTDALRGLAADVLLIVRDFTTRELRKDPRLIFGDATWEQLLSNGEVFAAERNECLTAIRSVEWGTDALSAAVEEYRCPECGSQLQRPVDPSLSLDDLVLACRSCGHEAEADEFVEDALKDGVDRFTPVKDGDRDPIGNCPNCMQEAFIIDEDVCARCGSGRTHSRCMRCDSELDLEEQELGGLCGYCEHVSSKDD
jgi:DNA-directed RNA polymerase subunit RPC12/RpoP